MTELADLAMPLYPTGERVLLALDAVEERKVGGIIVPDMHHEPTRYATVLRVGGGVTLYKPGDRVFLGYHAGAVIDRHGLGYAADTLRLVVEGEIWGYVKEAGAEADNGDVGLRPAES